MVLTEPALVGVVRRCERDGGIVGRREERHVLIAERGQHLHIVDVGGVVDAHVGLVGAHADLTTPVVGIGSVVNHALHVVVVGLLIEAADELGFERIVRKVVHHRATTGERSFQRTRRAVEEGAGHIEPPGVLVQ